MASRESTRHISCVPSMIKVFMSASTPRCRLPQRFGRLRKPRVTGLQTHRLALRPIAIGRWNFILLSALRLSHIDLSRI